MKSLMTALVVLSTSFAQASTPLELQKCLADFALTSIEEFNLPNEFLFSTSAEVKAHTISTLQRGGYTREATLAAKILPEAQAIGLVVQYSDEVHLHYVGVSVHDGQCQVIPAVDLNTADLTGENTGLQPQDAPIFFL